MSNDSNVIKKSYMIEEDRARVRCVLCLCVSCVSPHAPMCNESTCGGWDVGRRWSKVSTYSLLRLDTLEGRTPFLAIEHEFRVNRRATVAQGRRMAARLARGSNAAPEPRTSRFEVSVGSTDNR